MPTLTITKTIAYTDVHSGASMNITATKQKKATHAYRQVMTVADATTATIFEVGTDLIYTRLLGAVFENVGSVDAYLMITSGGTAAWVWLPAGRTFDLFSLDFYNADSATIPDTIDTISIRGEGGTARVKIDAYLA